jgi:acetyl-CoA carboxylase carboxyl transferase subunit alpha
LENAYYSVISPEGCAAILWKSGSRAPDAAAALRLTAQDLLKMELIDEVIPEPLGGAHRNPSAIAETLRSIVVKYLRELSALDKKRLLELRYEKFRKIGKFA